MADKRDPGEDAVRLVQTIKRRDGRAARRQECDAAIASRLAGLDGAISSGRPVWLPFLDTYRTLCVVPPAEFRRLLEDSRNVQFAA